MAETVLKKNFITAAMLAAGMLLLTRSGIASTKDTQAEVKAGAQGKDATVAEVRVGVDGKSELTAQHANAALVQASGGGEKKHKFGTVLIPKSVGNYMGYDYRDRDINSPDDQKFLQLVPGAASNKSIAAILHVGKNEHIEAAAAFGAEQFAHRVHDASLVILHDKDDNSKTGTLSIYAHGEQYVIPVTDKNANDPSYSPWEIKLDDSMSQKEIAVEVYKAMQGAYNKLLAPQISQAQTDTPTLVATN